MSENMKSRQNRVRRNVTALVSAVALACGTTAVVAPISSGIEVTQVQPGWGEESGPRAQVDVSLSRSVENPEPGENFTYTVEVKAVAPKPVQDPTYSQISPGESAIHADGAGSVFELQFKPDPKTPISNLENPKFEWRGLADGIKPFLLKNDKGEVIGKGYDPDSGYYFYRFQSNLPPASDDFAYSTGWLGNDVSLTATFDATVAEGSQPADEFSTSAAGIAYLLPTASWTYAKSVEKVDSCTTKSVHQYRLNGADYGTWLRDIKVGTTFPNNQTVGTPTLRVTNLGTNAGDPAQSATWKVNDTEPPEDWTLSSALQGQQINWMHAWHWAFDPTTRTGRQWIADGTTFEVEHVVRNTDCARNPDAFLGEEPREITNSTLNIAQQSLPRPNGAGTELKWSYTQPLEVAAAIGDRVWIDTNGNGIQDDGETGVPNVKVTATVVEVPEGVSLTDAQRTGSAVTDADGVWQIDGLYPGATYKVEFDAPTLPEGFVPTRTGVGDFAKDSNGLSFNTDAIAEGTGGNNLTYDLGIFKPASVGDFVWDDGVEGQNDGIQGAGEAGVADVTVTLTDKTGNPVTDVNGKQVEPRKTDADGKYLFENLFPGEYTVTFSDLPDGFKGETKSIEGREDEDSNGLVSAVTLASGQSDLSVDLGLIKPKPVVPTPTATIGDRVWIDKNGNGIQDNGEPGVPNVKVSVREQGRGAGPAVETTTDGNGNWKVEGLTPGKQYNVRFELPNGYYETVSTAGEDLEKDSNGLAFSTKTLTEGSGGFNLSYDLGLVQPATIGDFVWDDGEYTVTGDGSKVGVKDTDYNGVQDSEKGIANVRVTITDASGNSVKDINGKVIAPATTDADGKYLFENLRPGTYTVNFSYPQGYEETKPGQGNEDTDSNGLTTEVTLESGQSDLTVDLGLVRRNATQTTTTVTNPPTTTPTVTLTTPPNCTSCTPTTVVSNIPTTVKETEVVVTTVKGEPTTLIRTTEVEVTKEVPTTVKGEPTTLTRTTEVEVTKEVPTTVVKTTTNKVVITDENTAIIGDKVFIDTNGDGKQDPNENEGVPGVSVIVTGKDGEEQRTVTDKDGNWHLVVQPGDFTVRYETDRIPSDPELIERTVTLKPGEENRDIDLGVLRPGSVGDRVWNDTNGDGKQDEGEEGIPNITVKISREGEPARFTVTDEKGFWLIDELSPNTDYTVEFLTPEGWTRTNEVPNTVKVKPGESIDTFDLGLRKVEPEVVEKPGSLNGVIRVKDKDGVERGFEGLVVTVTPPEGVDEETRRTVTDEGGAWSVTNLTPGVNYRVEYIVPEGYDVTNLPKGWTVEDGRIVVDQTIDESNPVVLELGFTLQPKVLAPTTVTETTTVTAPDGSSSDFLDRCWANATQSPLLYLVPVALLGAVAGEFAKPYMGVLNEQLAQINAELQAALNRNTPDFGDGGRGADRDDPFAELRAQINAANREVARIANDPDTQRLGAIALGVIGVIAAGGVIYDWCSSEPGEAVTASSIGKGKGATATPVTAPTTPTEPAAAQ